MDGEHRMLRCSFRGERFEAIPVPNDFTIPIIGPGDRFVYIEAADGSEVCFPAEDILTLHLKD